MGFFSRGDIRRRRRRRTDRLPAPVNGTPEMTSTQTNSAADLDAAGHHHTEEHVPVGVRVAASWAWRLLLIAALVLAIGWLLKYLSEVSIPIAVAILLTALLSPAANWIKRHGPPRGLAVALTMVLGSVLVSGTLALIGNQIAAQSNQIATSMVDGFNQFLGWLRNGPLHVPSQFLQLSRWSDRLQNFLINSRSLIAEYAADIGTQLGRFVAGLLIALFATFFFLYDGRGIWTFLVKLAPRRAQQPIDRAARASWTALVHYVRATILVAFTDAVGVLILALVLQIPLAPALAALVFLGAFVPIVGAFASGFVAVLVALVLVGWVQAVIMLAGIVVVAQMESHILQPFLLGRAVRLHPLAVLLAISIGIIVGGVVGALLSVPLLAFVKTFVQTVARTDEHGLVHDPAAHR